MVAKFNKEKGDASVLCITHEPFDTSIITLQNIGYSYRNQNGKISKEAHAWFLMFVEP